jgi:adenosylmethionine-8-amino-7-oxononanoate aminotransferase
VHRAILEAPADAKFMIGCTNAAHPTACAVALRNLQIFDDEGLVERAERMGQRLNDGLAALLEMPHVGNVRGLGLMAAVEVVADKATRQPFAPSDAVGLTIAKEMRQRGVVTRAKGDSILFAPPLVITEEELDRMIDVTAAAIDAVTKGHG